MLGKGMGWDGVIVIHSTWLVVSRTKHPTSYILVRAEEMPNFYSLWVILVSSVTMMRLEEWKERRIKVIIEKRQ
jgi:hypothetical protein